MTMTTINTTLTMTSREIAELTGKRHADVMRDIRNMFEELEIAKEGYEQNCVHPQNGQTYQIFNLDKDLTMCLVTGYSVKLRMAVIQDLERKTQALEAIRNAKTLEDAKFIAEVALAKREVLRVNHPSTTKVIAANVDTLACGTVSQAQINTQRLAVTVTLGKAPSVIKKETGMAPREYLLSINDVANLGLLDRNLAKIETMAELGLSYQEIKAKLV